MIMMLIKKKFFLLWDNATIAILKPTFSQEKKFFYEKIIMKKITKSNFFDLCFFSEIFLNKFFIYKSSNIFYYYYGEIFFRIAMVAQSIVKKFSKIFKMELPIFSYGTMPPLLFSNRLFPRKKIYIEYFYV
jgi:hypothetical protein